MNDVVKFQIPGARTWVEVNGPTSWEDMGDELDMAVDLFEQAIRERGLVGGTTRGHLEMLAATAYALGRADERVSDHTRPPTTRRTREA